MIRKKDSIYFKPHFTMLVPTFIFLNLWKTKYKKDVAIEKYPYNLATGYETASTFDSFTFVHFCWMFKVRNTFEL